MAKDEAAPGPPGAEWYSSVLGSGPVPLNTYSGSAEDTIQGHQAIFDFTDVPHSPDQAIALLSFTVHAAAPGGWERDRSLTLFAFQDANRSPRSQSVGTTWTQQCPLGDWQVMSAMRAAGHEPLPERVEPGHDATGWVAFRIPRGRSALVLRSQWLYPDGSVSATGPLSRG